MRQGFAQMVLIKSNYTQKTNSFSNAHTGPPANPYAPPPTSTPPTAYAPPPGPALMPSNPYGAPPAAFAPPPDASASTAAAYGAQVSRDIIILYAS